MKSAGAAIRVLSVEDDPADGELLKRVLEDLGDPRLELTQATCVVDALEALRVRFFPLVVTDLNLPDVEGLQTLYRLREASPESAFVVVTGVEDREAGVRALQLGAQDYLTKGAIAPQRLWYSLRNALIRQRMLRDVAVEVKKLGEANARLEVLARLDPLTGLYNRRGFDQLLEKALPADGQWGGAVLMVDIDNFKELNDRLGHDRGDQALQEVGQILLARLRPSDFAARVGGDEFLVVLPGLRLEEASETAERIRRAVEATPIPSAGGPFHVTVSIGVLRQEGPDITAHQLLARTHDALSRCKHGGKNMVSLDPAATA